MRETVLEQSGVKIELRGPAGARRADGRAFTHPAVVSAVRLSHILARVDARLPGGEGGRIGVFPVDSLFTVGEGVSRALARAQPHQEVVGRIVRKERRFGLFTHEYLTGLVLWVEGDSLYVHISHVDWEIPRSRDDVPDPSTGRHFMRHRLVPSEGIEVIGQQTARVEWRDDLFAKPGAITSGRGGRLRRRTILMESAEPDPPAPGAARDEGRLAAATLRRLADLEQARERGEVSEEEYRVRREAILAEDPSRR